MLDVVLCGSDGGRVEGFLEKMTFEEGKRVRMNEPLFYINDDQYKARVEKAKAQLKKDEAQAAKAERDVQRLRPLYEQNAASQLDLDNAVAALDMAQGRFAAGRIGVELHGGAISADGLYQ